MAYIIYIYIFICHVYIYHVCVYMISKDTKISYSCTSILVFYSDPGVRFSSPEVFDYRIGELF